MSEPGDATQAPHIDRVEVIVTAEIPMPYGYVFRADGNLLARLRAGVSKSGEMLSSKCLAYVVHHPLAGTIVIDTGFHADAAQHRRRDFGTAMSLLFGGIRPAPDPFDSQLRALGIEPEQVESVVMTHLHVDHTSGMRLLPRATFTCAREEWAAARQRFASAKGYVSRHLPAESRMRLLDFERDGSPYESFSATIDLLGDGSVRLISTPGHTPGHLSVLLAVSAGRKLLLVGDAAYTRRSIEEQRLPMLTADDSASRRSLRELDAFGQAHPGAVLVPTHDPDAWRDVEQLHATSRRADGGRRADQPVEAP